MTDRVFLPVVVFALLLLFLAGAGVQCSLRPALVNWTWERREKPIFPIRKKMKPVEVEKGAVQE